MIRFVASLLIAALCATAHADTGPVPGLGPDGRLLNGYVAVDSDLICVDSKRKGKFIWCDVRRPVLGTHADVRDADGDPYEAFVLKVEEIDKKGGPVTIIAE